MHHRPGPRPGFIKRRMKRHLLVGASPESSRPPCIQMRQAGRVKISETGPGRGDQQAAILQPDRDIAAGPGGQAAVIHGFRQRANLVSVCGLSHPMLSIHEGWPARQDAAFSKKSVAPKLPLFSAITKSASEPVLAPQGRHAGVNFRTDFKLGCCQRLNHRA